MVKRTTQGIAHRGVEVFLLLFLTLALSMSLAFTPGALAFAEVSGQGDEKESLPVEQLVESEKKAHPNSMRILVKLLIKAKLKET
ncbi:MAG: hypothetical protein ACOYD7_00455 [Raoultibacter sp.]